MLRFLYLLCLLTLATVCPVSPADENPTAAASAADSTEPTWLRQDFHLMDQDNQVFDLHRLAGKWTFIYLGYTHCPDICPTTTLTLNRLIDRLQLYPQHLVNTQVVFVSIDPLRDAQNIIGEFLAYYNTKFIGVTGSYDELLVLTKQLQIKHRLLSATDIKTREKRLLVEHGADIVLLDPALKIAGRFHLPHDDKTLLAGYLELRDQFEQSETDFRTVVKPERSYVNPPAHDAVGALQPQ